jgi:(2Fe-2S) ferredoxin
MSRRARRPEPAPAAGGSAAGCTLTVCRGGLCGTPRAPGTGHDAQLAALRQSLAGAAAQVRVSGCLDACSQANVIVVQPSAAGRAAGGRPVWLGLVNDADATDDIAAWVRAGGPAVACASSG